MQVGSTAEWRQAGSDFLRALTGGLVFGIPLLYTMEVWWLGQAVDPARAAVALAVAFLPVFLLVSTGGFRRRPEVGTLDALLATFETLGIAVVSAAGVLVLLRRITLDTPLHTALGMAVFEAVPFAVGVAVAREVLVRAGDEPPGKQPKDKTGAGGTVADLGATAIGALFIGLSIAPTEEVPMLAARISPPWTVALVVVSVAISYSIVFAAGFMDEASRHAQLGVLQRPMTETVVAYVLALAVAALMLWFFGNLSAGAPWTESLNRVVVLGLPAAVGGAAGRVVV